MAQYQGDPRLAQLRSKQQGYRPTVNCEEDPRVVSGVGAKAAVFQQKATAHQSSQAHNPFSGQYQGPSYVQPHKDDASYGRPPEGSKTEFRGKQAGVHISTEVVELCGIIQELGQEQPNGTFAITFGFLFDTYTKISNKLVGMLMRARKQGLVVFEGEMLYQRRDEDKIIYLINTPDKLMADIEQKKSDLQQHDQYKGLKK